MFTRVDTKFPTDVEVEVARLFHLMFPEADRGLVARAFDWANQCFTGSYRGYQAIDAKYHDFEHTLQGTLCLIRLLYARHQTTAEPRLNLRLFELGLLAILMHDTGYLKADDDTHGTGAKYTPIHVDRSAQFAAYLMRQQGYGPADIKAVQNMIFCTGVNVDLAKIRFADEMERTVGFALGSADLLGQMAADDYVDKLPILYSEFEEAAQFNQGLATNIGTFSSVRDLMVKTQSFWKFYVLKKINEDFRGLYRFLNLPYPDGANWYLDRIQVNLQRIEAMLAKA